MLRCLSNELRVLQGGLHLKNKTCYSYLNLNHLQLDDLVFK